MIDKDRVKKLDSIIKLRMEEKIDMSDVETTPRRIVTPRGNRPRRTATAAAIQFNDERRPQTIQQRFDSFINWMHVYAQNYLQQEYITLDMAHMPNHAGIEIKMVDITYGTHICQLVDYASFYTQPEQEILRLLNNIFNNLKLQLLERRVQEQAALRRYSIQPLESLATSSTIPHFSAPGRPYGRRATNED